MVGKESPCQCAGKKQVEKRGEAEASPLQTHCEKLTSSECPGNSRIVILDVIEIGSGGAIGIGQ
jgi:hypothetical protein